MNYGGGLMSIELRDIYKSFGSNEVLKGVNLSVEDGEICALIGENGAGKSTLMNILGGVIKKDSGKIRRPRPHDVRHPGIPEPDGHHLAPGTPQSHHGHHEQTRHPHH